MNIKYIRQILIISMAAFIGSCAYYNTMFNALEYYKRGTDKREKSKDNQITTDIQKDFNAAIDKCWKLINIYSDSNAYADDALLLIGKSHYQIEEYSKSERFLSQFVVRYPDSDLLPEAQLWLARSLSELERKEEAIEVLSGILGENVSPEIRYQALFSMGELSREQEKYDLAVSHLNACIEQTDDDKLAATALLTLGDIYSTQQEYVTAIETYSRLKEYDAPVQIEFEAVMNKVNAQIKLSKFDEAIRSLRMAGGESRFIEFLPQMESRIGEIYTLQGDVESAELQYIFVLENYPRTDGAATAAFGLAQLTETFRADPDSARNLYLRVSKESRTSEYIKPASDRATLLQNYLKIKESINKDLSDLNALVDSDSLPAETENFPDSVETGQKAVNVKSAPKRKTAQDIKKSLENNKFGLAEFYLLNMQNYDSARVAYSEFTSAEADSVLKIKAYYALYYLNKFHLKNQTAADSIKKVILRNYPQSEFAEYFKAQDRTQIVHQDSVDTFKLRYLEAESMLFNNEFSEALRLFNEIAVEDSGSIWAEKSRYAVAWIYENKLKDIGRAVEAYTNIVKEYPKTKFANIARNKIKEPPPEQQTEITSGDSATVKHPDKRIEPTVDKKRDVESLEESFIQPDSLETPGEQQKADKDLY